MEIQNMKYDKIRRDYDYDATARLDAFDECFGAVSDFKVYTINISKNTYSFKYDGKDSGKITTEELLNENLLNQRLICLSTKLFPHPVTAGERRMYEMFWADQVSKAYQEEKVLV